MSNIRRFNAFAREAERQYEGKFIIEAIDSDECVMRIECETSTLLITARLVLTADFNTSRMPLRVVVIEQAVGSDTMTATSQTYYSAPAPSGALFGDIGMAAAAFFNEDTTDARRMAIDSLKSNWDDE